MICVKQLVRQVESGEHARALSRVLDNGRDGERQLQTWLRSHPLEMANIALGLSLTRLAELTYGPTDEGSRLAARLMQSQQEAGGFGADDFCPVSTAVALAGLMFHLDQYLQVSMEPEARLADAVDRASIALADWIIDQKIAGQPSEEMALVRTQLEATSVLNVSAGGMVRGDAIEDAPAMAQSVAA